MRVIYEPLRLICDDMNAADEWVTGAVLVWINGEKPDGLNFIYNIPAGDEKRMAALLRSHADGLDPPTRQAKQKTGKR